VRIVDEEPAVVVELQNMIIEHRIRIDEGDDDGVDGADGLDGDDGAGGGGGDEGGPFGPSSIAPVVRTSSLRPGSAR